jgi:hypothetical protein
VGRMWTGFIWLRLGTGLVSCENGDEHFLFPFRQEILIMRENVLLDFVHRPHYKITTFRKLHSAFVIR